MTADAGSEKAATAASHHESGAYEAVASAYTAAAHEYLGANGLDHAVTTANGLQHLLVGAACLRVAGRADACRNRCQQGAFASEAVAEVAETVPAESSAYDHSVRGVWHEFAGDFRVLGDVEGASGAYAAAETVYADAGDPDTGCFEQFHLAAAVLPKLIVRGTDADPDELERVLSPPATLTDWMAFKRERLPELVERLDDRDDWTYVF